MRSRAAVDAAEGEDVDEVGRRTVLDQGDDDDAVALDFSPGAETEGSPESTRRRLLEFARRAEALDAADDRKLQGAVREIKGAPRGRLPPRRLLPLHRHRGVRRPAPARRAREGRSGGVGHRPAARRAPHAEREERIARLTANPGAGGGRFVLVCTDCLSEGINLQEHFDAVLHYDLAWNPTRHEQREGRVDRFGQEKSEVRVVTWYGADNPIDGVILDVLIRKHKSIRSALGVTVAVPGSSEQIAEALFEGALFRERAGGNVRQLALDFIDEFDVEMQAIHAEWENARDREKVSRSRFAQHTPDPGAVAAEIDNVRTAIGRSEDVDRFLTTVLQAANVPVRRTGRAVTGHANTNTLKPPPAEHRRGVNYYAVFAEPEHPGTLTGIATAEDIVETAMKTRVSISPGYTAATFRPKRTQLATGRVRVLRSRQGTARPRTPLHPLVRAAEPEHSPARHSVPAATPSWPKRSTGACPCFSAKQRIAKATETRTRGAFDSDKVCST